MKKYPKVKRLGHRDNDGILDAPTVFVQEKMDGANFRFMLEDHLDEEYHVDGRELVFGSRNVVYKNEKDIDGSFEHAIEFVRESVDPEVIREYENKHGQLIFYGEAMHSHTLDYEWDDVPSFLGFDTWSEKWDGFAHPEKMAEVFEEIGLPTVPSVYFGPPDTLDATEVPDSEYRDGKAEGVLIKTEYDNMAKVRSEKFKELHGANHSHDGNDDSDDRDDAEVLADKFTTEARVLKMIHKMENEGEVVEMSMMEGLWQRVFDDIIDEEYDTILHSNYVVDTKDFRSEVASRCATILEQYISRPDDSVLNEVNA